ncbi:MAG: type II secretion system F family protein [Blastocatellia bacterium]|nr:type II secretion system F family protein [Blastocatellia bacterium]
MLAFIMISTFICITFGSIGLYWAMMRRGNAIAARLQPMEKIRAETAPPAVSDPGEGLAEKVTKPLTRLAPPSATEAQKLQKLLLQAGYYSHNAPAIYRGMQLASMFGFPLLTAIVCLLLAQPIGRTLFAGLVAFVIGFSLPRYALNHLIKRRQERLCWGLADALDLMVVSMEAGLGMNAAMVRVSEELKDAHPEISEEFEIVSLEIRVGRDRLIALRNLSERTGVEDLRSFVAMLIQADRFGTSIGRAVRVYSESLRTKRRQRAEQAAQKAAVKLLFPLTCFLFPTLFIIILGPAGISIMDAFGGGLRK